MSPHSKLMTDRHRTIYDRLVGTWYLVDFVERTTNGNLGPVERPFGPNPSGILIYTADGHVSVQLMKLDRPLFASGYWLEGTPEEFFDEATGYLAYAGTFDVDEQTETVTHHMAVALFPNWAGGKQERKVVLQGDELTLKTGEYNSPSGGRLLAELTWSRGSNSS
jgi:hypothetical protein